MEQKRRMRRGCRKENWGIRVGGRVKIRVLVGEGKVGNVGKVKRGMKGKGGGCRRVNCVNGWE